MCLIEPSSTETIGAPNPYTDWPRRPHDPPVQHPGQPDVLDEDLLPGDDRRDLDPRLGGADQLVLAERLRGRLPGWMPPKKPGKIDVRSML